MDGILVGFISGVISSVFVTLALFGIKPRITISNEICRTYVDDCYWIKIVNRTWFNLVDVKYSFQHCRRLEDGNATVTEIQPVKSRMEYLDKYSSNGINEDYALQISYKIPDDLELLEGDQLVFTIFARHSFSGTVRFWTKEYSIDAIKCGIFQTGKSTKIVQEKCGHKHKTCWEQGFCEHPAHSQTVRR